MSCIKIEKDLARPGCELAIFQSEGECAKDYSSYALRKKAVEIVKIFYINSNIIV